MFDFRKVCDVADYLALRDGEEYTRSAISRYYYSLFCCARLYLILVIGETIFFTNKDIHKKVCNRLIESSDLTESSVGFKLDRLRYLRNLADYDWYEKDNLFFNNKLNFTCSEAKTGIEQLDSLRNSLLYKV